MAGADVRGQLPVMSSLRDQFAHFYMPDETIEAAMTTGLAVPDANVLLNLIQVPANRGYGIAQVGGTALGRGDPDRVGDGVGHLRQFVPELECGPGHGDFDRAVNARWLDRMGDALDEGALARGISGFCPHAPDTDSRTTGKLLTVDDGVSDGVPRRTAEDLL